ncbi:MAG: hypothetical protein HYT76_06070 [Deltaproteobacteria bacterium]|nr:hypothetical protein [Deltaproteobacteria bacterium]
MDPAIGKLMGELALPKESGGPAGGAANSDFNKILEGQLSQTDDTKMIEQALGLENKSPSMKVMSADQISLDPSQVGLEGQRTDPLHLLNEVNRSALQMDQMIEMVTSGGSFSPQELLAIQAGVYQIVQEVDLTGQIVSSADRARNSLLNIQI